MTHVPSTVPAPLTSERRSVAEGRADPIAIRVPTNPASEGSVASRTLTLPEDRPAPATTWTLENGTEATVSRCCSGGRLPRTTATVVIAAATNATAT